MEGSIVFKDVLIVIVLFRQTPEQSAAYTSLCDILRDCSPIPDIFIYDNSPTPCKCGPPVIYVHDLSNSGVSKAYNEAAVIATENNKTWMLLLDQDTAVTRDLFDEWERSMIRHPGSVAFVPVMRDALGPASPFSFARGGGNRLRIVREKFPLRKYRFINTGLFIKREAFIRVGGYDERLPLDFSDISFGRRLMEVTDHFIVMNVTLRHTFSGSTRLSYMEALTRFRSFCMGASAVGKKSGMPYVYWLRTFARALRLSFRYKSSSFIRIFFEPSGNG
jgi:GT2 family glycosyltransferase